MSIIFGAQAYVTGDFSVRSLPFIYQLHVALCMCRALAEVPGVPEKLAVAEALKSSVKLTWAAPSNDGGTPVTGYQIERCLADSTRWIRVGKSTETSYTDKEVVEDTQYLYRVIAENKVGPGPPCEPTSPPVTAKDPWSESNSCSALSFLNKHYQLLFNDHFTKDGIVTDCKHITKFILKMIKIKWS